MNKNNKVKSIQFIDENKIPLIAAVDLMMPSVFDYKHSEPFKMLVLMTQEKYEVLTRSEKEELKKLKEKYIHLLSDNKEILNCYNNLINNYYSIPGRPEYQMYLKNK